MAAFVSNSDGMGIGCSNDPISARTLREYIEMFGRPDNTKKKGVIRAMKLIARKALNKDLRTLIKAGILDDELDIENQEFVLQFVVNKYTKELAEEAQKVLDEQEK